MVLGLLLEWNGSAFHRGPTHSLAFAWVAGFLASEVSKRWDRLPRMGFWTCFALILSHVMADALLSPSAVSLLWPLETHWSSGHSDWGDVVGMVLRGDRQDAWITLAACIIIIAYRTARVMGLRRKGIG